MWAADHQEIYQGNFSESTCSEDQLNTRRPIAKMVHRNEYSQSKAVGRHNNGALRWILHEQFASRMTSSSHVLADPDGAVPGITLTRSSHTIEFRNVVIKREFKEQKSLS